MSQSYAASVDNAHSTNINYTVFPQTDRLLEFEHFVQYCGYIIHYETAML
jgi:hypothetical protein